VSLCLFADDGTETKLSLTARTGDVWHAYVHADDARSVELRVAGICHVAQRRSAHRH
jgi:hypothetical protein